MTRVTFNINNHTVEGIGNNNRMYLVQLSTNSADQMTLIISDPVIACPQSDMTKGKRIGTVYLMNKSFKHLIYTICTNSVHRQIDPNTFSDGDYLVFELEQDCQNDFEKITITVQIN